MARKPRSTEPNGWPRKSDAELRSVATELMYQDLIKSGLDLEDAEAAGFEVATPLEVAEFLGYELYRYSGYLIPYWDPLTGKPMRRVPSAPDFKRVKRLLTEEETAILMTTEDGRKELQRKYMTPQNGGVCAYFPPVIGWQELLDEKGRVDKRTPIILTEGEKKAYKSCKEYLEGRSYPTIGLGGVSNVSASHEDRGLLLPELVPFCKNRIVYIVFDSDVASNPQVAKAHNRLVEMLSDEGAHVRTIVLNPNEDQGKCGLDDWFVENPGLAFTVSYLPGAVNSSTSSKIIGMNDKYCHVGDQVWNLKSYRGQGLGLFKSAMLGENLSWNELSPKVIKSKDGEETESLQWVTKTGPAAEVWLRSPLHLKADYVTYEPNKELFIDTRDGRFVNLWRPRKYSPKKGSVVKFLELVDLQVDDADPHHEDNVLWILQWLAYVYRAESGKSNSAIILCGNQGTGKSMLLNIVRELMDGNSVQVTQAVLESDFNDTYAFKELVTCNEAVSLSDKRSMDDKLKAMITDTTMQVNTKGLSRFTIPDYANYMFTTNNPDSFYAVDGTRRYAVFGSPDKVESGSLNHIGDVYLTVKSKVSLEERQRLEDGREDAYRALAYFLLNDVDISNFNPEAPPRTEILKQMIVESRTETEVWVELLLSEPDEALRIGNTTLKDELLDFAQVCACYQNWCTEVANVKVQSSVHLSKKLRHAGVKVLPTKVNNRNLKIYPVRNIKHWNKATHAERAEYLGHKAPEKEKKAPKSVVNTTGIVSKKKY